MVTDAKPHLKVSGQPILSAFVKPEQVVRFDAAARRRGLSRSAYLRSLVIAAIAEEETL